MCLRNLLFVTLFVGATHFSGAQRNFGGYNLLGLTGGFTMFDIITSDLSTQQGEGFTVGFTTRGSVYNNFDLIYGLGFHASEIRIGTNQGEAQFIEYQLQSAQISVLGSINIIHRHLSLEAGPILNVNGKLKLKNDALQDYILTGYNSLTAGEIQDISKVNFHLGVGITGGFERFRVNAQYQYGVTNTLNKLNDKNLENPSFKGNTSLLVFAVIFYF